MRTSTRRAVSAHSTAPTKRSRRMGISLNILCGAVIRTGLFCHKKLNNSSYDIYRIESTMDECQMTEPQDKPKISPNLLVGIRPPRPLTPHYSMFEYQYCEVISTPEGEHVGMHKIYKPVRIDEV